MEQNNSIIALITSDSLRRDFVGCYTSENGAKTPFIDSLASSGVRYDNAFSHGGGTPDSFPSIMCSCRPPLTTEERKVSGRKKIAQILKESGFKTAAFHSNPYLTSFYGYDEGFDVFDDGGITKPQLPKGIQNVKYAFNQCVLNKGPIVNAKTETDRAINWLRNTKGPRFLWVHYMDNHFPYLPPTSYTGVVGSLKNRFMWLSLLSKGIQNKVMDQPDSTKSMIKRGYRECIRAIDHSIGILCQKLYKSSKSVSITLTSDHGEGFWEHGYFGHCGLYDEILRVPLICAGSEIPKGMVSNEIVGLSDILPSILTPLGLEQPGIIGRLLPHTREESSSTQERFIVTANLDPPNSRRFSGIRTSSYKYFREEIKNEATEYLFDLNKDPRELNNIFSENDPTVASLRQTLNDELGGVPDNAFSPPLSKEEEKEIEGRLQALGYT